MNKNKITTFTIIFIFLVFLDALMSICAVKAGLAQELNPLNHILENYFWLAKAIAALFVVWLAHRYSHERGIVTCTIFMGLVVIWNMFNVILSIMFLR